MLKTKRKNHMRSKTFQTFFLFSRNIFNRHEILFISKREEGKPPYTLYPRANHWCSKALTIYYRYCISIKDFHSSSIFLTCSQIKIIHFGIYKNIKKSLLLIWNMIFVHILENYFSHHTDTFLKKVSLFDFRKKWWKNRKKNPKLFIL